MSELWELVWGKSEVDPAALARAIEIELECSETDTRTRMLIRESTLALEQYWGKEQLQKWLSRSQAGAKIEAIRKEDLGESKFPFLKEQLVESTKPETVKEYLRELGSNLNERVTLQVGGSIALILTGYLERATTDIDIVDEVPNQIREHRELLEGLERRYKLLLTHFQSHYLPSGWQERLQFQGSFGNVELFTVDVYDLILGKVFSNRSKDLDDLRMVKPRIEKDKLVAHLKKTAGSLLTQPSLREAAKKNWYILYGEDLPEQD